MMAALDAPSFQDGKGAAWAKTLAAGDRAASRTKSLRQCVFNFST